MTQTLLPADLLTQFAAKQAAKRAQRRQFFRNAGGLGVGMIGGTILAACGGSDGDDAVAQTPPPAGPSDADILNFALNLEYLEAQFYLYAVSGNGLPDNQKTGAGRPVGPVTPGRQVTFTDPLVSQYAREIAADEQAHVVFLRQALGSAAAAHPAIDVGFQDPNGAFSTVARAAGLVGPGQIFDPYLNDDNFLLGAFIFEDVGVTAYKGAAPLITNKTFLEAAAGILAAEAYHAALVRTVLYARGVATPALRTNAEAISNARDLTDGTSEDKDQGITGTDPAVSNIVPLDANGIAFSRTTGDVLNIVYINAGAVTQGGFLPAGINGAGSLNTSSAA
ncbi:MAG: ferritin-like domain-containing protein [Pseudomonadota bacterium]|nr:ferritin-like domain-containing protein [Burkholderiales bacterium]MDQ3196324.1 ferritin-like domain-containing protein [Pseudomonadota bacterium]